MKNLLSFGIGIVLAWLPGTSLAQNFRLPPDIKRFYAAAYWNSSNYLFDFQAVPQVRRINPWRVDAGIYLTSRMAVQVGFMASKPNGEAMDTGFSSGQRIDIIQEDGGIELAAPILVRYCLTRQLAEKLKFDAIGGVTLGYSNPTLTTTRKIDGQVVEQTEMGTKLNSSYYTAGLGVRWVFSPRWEAVFDWTFSRNIAPVPKIVYSLAGTRNGITRSLGLGLRYRFDFVKKSKREEEIIIR